MSGAAPTGSGSAGALSADAVVHRIGGKADEGTPERWSDVTDPARGIVTRRVAIASQADVDRAVAAAAEVHRTWRSSSIATRTKVMFAFRELLERHADHLAACITAEHGKVLADARAEVQRGIEVVEFACGIGTLLKGGHSGNVSSDVDSWSIRQSLGVCVGITPFNFPAMVPMWMYPVAIACGNTFVLKPSEQVPSASALAADLLAEAGLPDGVFNVVNGDGAVAQRLVEHPQVAAVSFVGSTAAARSVYTAASATGKRVQALGGAKNHAVVLPDADVDAAADAIAAGAFGSAGERCMAVSVVVAVGGVMDRLRPALAARMDAITVSAGDDPSADMGPLVSAPHRARVAGHVEAGLAEGATLVHDRRDDVPEGGYFLGPCLFEDVTPDMSIYREEIFGPVLCTVAVDGLDEAIDLVNANPNGNGVAIFTADGRAARRFEHEVEVGMVGVNVPVPVPMSYYSFGGWKASRFGGDGVHGEEGIRFFTRTKTVTARWPESTASSTLHFPTNR